MKFLIVIKCAFLTNGSGSINVLNVKDVDR